MKVVIVTCDWVKVGSEPSESSKRSNIQAPEKHQTPNTKTEITGGFGMGESMGKMGGKRRGRRTVLQGIPGENRLFPGEEGSTAR